MRRVEPRRAAAGALTVAAAAAASGCATVIPHATRVTPGLAAGGAIGMGPEIAAALCDSTCRHREDTVHPPLGAYLRYGYTPRGQAGPGVQATLYTALSPLGPLAPLFGQGAVDLYGQAPVRRDGWLLGGGVAIGSDEVAPYLQVGRERAGERRGREWFAALARVSSGRIASQPWLFDPTEWESGPLSLRGGTQYWSPTVGYVLRQGRGVATVTIHATAAIGQEAYRAEFRPDPSRPTEPVARGAQRRRLGYLYVGMQAELTVWRPDTTRRVRVP